MLRGTNEYKNFHARLARSRGKAKEFSCEDCGEQASEWSWSHGTDKYDFDNYFPLCRSCHAKYDLKDSTIKHLSSYCGIKNGNSRFTEEMVLEIRAKYSSGGYSHRLLADEYETSRSHIARIVNGKAWKAVPILF